MKLSCFPYPNRNSKYTDKEIFSYKNKYTEFEELKKEYERKVSSETSNIKNQYLYIEEELMRSFQYVQPNKKNLTTSSVGFASIIREASNLYEILAKSVYCKYYKVNEDYDLNIYNYLSLDSFLDLSNEILDSPILYAEFNGTNILQPFKSLTSWDKNSSIKAEHIPDWWNSYNSIKHNVNGITECATLKNALLSVGAVYLLINRIYGEGVVSGVLRAYRKSSSLPEQLLVPVSKLFIEETELVSVAVWG